ncbi:TRAP transporter small permease [Gracilibacillus kekensis]|uniref:TRAP-type C4-dicarboxylate transport system, small permease component n=1 Tax=Gracilibacillus kekensis TaxID=1027249 RepID=A0A1M7N9J0_9BACI|nr:TRAP transporter small permease [Gracilibacillus kekensis]SHM99743.1 TRAP-type C4-dicarboxylate transport system, small permease component [Gracilibacillus kekensis]
MLVDKIKKVLDRTILIVASFLLVVLVLGALWQVFTRYVLQNPSTFTNELLGFLLVWTSLLGACYAFGSNKHLALTFVTNKLSGSRKLIITIINDLFVVFFAVVILLQGGIDAVNTTMAQTTPILGIQKGIVYTILPISGVLIILYKLLNVKNYFQTNQGEGE